MNNFGKTEIGETMENYKKSTIEKIKESAAELIGKGWMLITAGNLKSFNTMTASWGNLGHLWNKNVAIMYIRPQRYTKEFVDREDIFTLSFFKEDYRKALNICGSKSGRDGDKVKEAGLTPIATPNGSVSFKEAHIILECRKLYKDELKPEGFIDKSISNEVYPTKDFHIQYIGEILAVYVGE
jgi:flavin reductase (DIM6/NTAB) family NADH-FMN oxidoreductase RutF